MISHTLEAIKPRRESRFDKYIYIYIYIERERETYIYIYVYLYIYIYLYRTEDHGAWHLDGPKDPGTQGPKGPRTQGPKDPGAQGPKVYYENYAIDYTIGYTILE